MFGIQGFFASHWPLTMDLPPPGNLVVFGLQYLKTAAIRFSGITGWICRGVIPGWTGSFFDFGLMPLCLNFLDVPAAQYDAIGESETLCRVQSAVRAWHALVSQASYEGEVVSAPGST